MSNTEPPNSSGPPPQPPPPPPSGAPVAKAAKAQSHPLDFDPAGPAPDGRPERVNRPIVAAPNVAESAPRPAASVQPEPDPEAPKRTYSLSERPERPPVPTVRSTAPPPPPAAPPPAAPPPAAPPPAAPPPVTRPPVHDLSDLLSQIGDGSVADTPGLGAKLTDPRDVQRPKGLGPVTIKSSGAIDFNPEFASFATRLAGFLIDSVVTLAAIGPGLMVLLLGPGVLRFSGILIAIIGLALVARWYGSTVSTSGQWVGNRVTDTKVVDVSSGDLLDRTHATSRFLVRALISPVLLFGFIVAFTNSQHRAFHDQFAGSIVTRPARASWSLDDDGPIDDAPDGKPAQ